VSLSLFDESRFDSHCHVLDPARFRFPYPPDVAYRPAGQEQGTLAQYLAVMTPTGSASRCWWVRTRAMAWTTAACSTRCGHCRKRNGARILIDHCDRPTPDAGLDQPGFQALLARARTGRAAGEAVKCWLKQKLLTQQKMPNDEFIYLDVSSVNKETKEIENATVLLGKDAPSRARKLVRTNDVIFATVRPTIAELH